MNSRKERESPPSPTPASGAKVIPRVFSSSSFWMQRPRARHCWQWPRASCLASWGLRSLNLQEGDRKYRKSKVCLHVFLGVFSKVSFEPCSAPLYRMDRGSHLDWTNANAQSLGNPRIWPRPTTCSHTQPVTSLASLPLSPSLTLPQPPPTPLHTLLSQDLSTQFSKPDSY